MKHSEKIKLLGELFCLYEPSEKNDLKHTVIWKMMEHVKQGKTPILESYYEAYNMPHPYTKHQDSIWDYLAELTKDSDKSPVTYAAEHYHKPFMSSTSMGFQAFGEMMTNIVYQRISEEIIRDISDKKKNLTI